MASGKAERVLIGLGGNIGEPAVAMGHALQMLDRVDGISVAAVSGLYRTAPWGRTDQPDFLNAAALLLTEHEPLALLALCLDIEHRLKRERRERWGPRTIDIDILLFGDRRIEEPELEVPHPRMTDRAFVMAPLAEIDPGLRIGGSSAAELVALLKSQRVERLTFPADWWRKDEVPRF